MSGELIFTTVVQVLILGVLEKTSVHSLKYVIFSVKIEYLLIVFYIFDIIN